MIYILELRRDIAAAQQLAALSLPLIKASFALTTAQDENPLPKLQSGQALVQDDAKRCLVYAAEAVRWADIADSLEEARAALRYAQLAEGIERRYALLSNNTPPLYPSLGHLTMSPLVQLCGQLHELFLLS